MGKIAYIWRACAILLVAAGLRFIGASFGQPNPDAIPSVHPYSHDQAVLHPDEYFYVSIPFEMVATERFSPNFFENPSILINTNYVLNRLLYIPIPDIEGLEGLGLRNHAPFSSYFFTRIISALGGILTVAAVIGLGRNFGKQSALFAGIIATLSFTLVQHSHYATTSTLASAGVTVCLWACIQAIDRNDGLKYLALASLAAAFAAGNRYNASAVSISVFIVGLWLFWQNRTLKQVISVGFAWSLFPIAFLVTSPFIVLHFDEFWRQFTFIWTRYSEATTAEALDGLYREHLYIVLLGIGLPAVIAVTVGIWHIARAKLFVLTILLVYLIPYTVVVLDTAVPQLSDQLTVVVIPVYAVFAGVGLYVIEKRWRLVGRILVGASILWLSVNLVSLLYLFNVPDTRETAQAWIQENIPENTSLQQLYSYNVPIDPMLYPNKMDFFPGEVGITDFVGDYLVLSDAIIFENARRLSLPDDELLRQALEPYNNPVLIHSIPRQRWLFDMLVNNNAVYWHHPSIKVYCLNQNACAINDS